MLPPFYIRNLWPPSLPKASQHTLVRINALSYDETILRHPAATLKYYDEDDGDLITLGSSKELMEKLEEPVSLLSSRLLANLQNDLQSSEHHVFEIDDHACVQKLWQALQSSNKDSEGVTSTQYQGDALKWSPEQKKSLAIFYQRAKNLTSTLMDRRKAEIWSPLAEELGVTWESVDAMHWALGEEEMTRRAHERNTCSEQSGGFEKTNKTEPDSTHNATITQHFEDYRVHHFNATRPPQVRLPMPVLPQLVKSAGPATIPRASNVVMDPSASSIVNKIEEANIAEEGKRQTQAQATGEIMRSRVPAVDSHQSGWPSHKPSTSAILPAPTSLSLAFDGPGLTSEGKRQAQVAGDKLRWRTNPIRHSRPSRVGASEHGISKNRWSSYGGTRATRFDERQEIPDESMDALITENNKEVPKNGQNSLLEVFEAELARGVSATGSKVPEFESPEVQVPVPELAVQVNFSSESQAQVSPQRSQALLGLINEHLHELTTGNVALSQDFSTVIGHGIRGLGACMQSIARGLQEVSSVSRQATNISRNADSNLIDDAVLGLQSLAGDFIAAFGGQIATNRSRITSAARSGPGEVEAGSGSVVLGMSAGKNPEEDTTTALKSSQQLSNGGDDLPLMAYKTGQNHGTAPSCISRKPTSLQSEIESQSRSVPTMSKESRFYEPGPIQPSNRSGYVDHLRQSQSVEIFDELYDTQRAISLPLDTHFPTLAQFEGEGFRAAPPFPPLPSMQPIVPQKAPRQYKYAVEAEESRLANGCLPSVSSSTNKDGSRQSHDTVNVGHEHSAQRDGNEVIPLNRLSSAARLAEPFDPLEPEPSARPYLTEGLRRNATIANTDIRRATRRRRPYSDVFDGSGRVPWGSFLRDYDSELMGHCRASDVRGRPLGTNQEEFSKRVSRPEAGARCSPPAAAGYDDQHHDDSTVGKINDCVEQLRDLGFGGEDGDSAGRLLIYAQAADGVLVDAIDLIDEEQRAWQRL